MARPAPARNGRAQRESAVCFLAVKGLSDKQIAAALAISFWTVRTHLDHAYGKCHASSRAELVHVALYEANIDIPAYLAAGSSGISFSQVIAQIASKDVQAAIGAATAFPKPPYDDAIRIYRPQLQKLYADYYATNGVSAILFPTTPLPAPPNQSDR